MAGAGIFLVGLAANLWLVFEWVGKSMGSLDISNTMRFALWGMTGLVVGVQTVYSSFFLSMLRMNRV